MAEQIQFYCTDSVGYNDGVRLEQNLVNNGNILDQESKQFLGK